MTLGCHTLNTISKKNSLLLSEYDPDITFPAFNRYQKDAVYWYEVLAVVVFILESMSVIAAVRLSSLGS